MHTPDRCSYCDKSLLTVIEYMFCSSTACWCEMDLPDRGFAVKGELKGNDLDLPPEHCQYRDEGCEFASSCLRCHVPRCIHDEPGGVQRWRKEQRDREIVRQFYFEGKGIKELSSAFGISGRTVQRALKA